MKVNNLATASKNPLVQMGKIKDKAFEQITAVH